MPKAARPAPNGPNDGPAFAVGVMLELNARGRAPEWVMLIPKGPRIEGNDGRVFWLKEPAEVVAAFRASGLSLPIDVNHSQFLKAPLGEESPAAGWIEELEARDGAVWGRVAWTAAGEAALNGRAYRYISPALITNKEGAVRALSGAGLVNRPNFPMPALNAIDGAAKEPKAAALFRQIMKNCGLETGALAEPIDHAELAREITRKCERQFL